MDRNLGSFVTSLSIDGIQVAFMPDAASSRRPIARKLYSDRLCLRSLSSSDVSSEYVAWLNDPLVYRFLETRYQRQDLVSVRQFVEDINASGNQFLFGIFVNATGKHIGNIKLGPISAVHSVADVGLMIGDRSSWGKGYATEAIVTISRHAFNELGIEKLSASMYVLNEGSRRAFLKAGYREEGRRRAHFAFEGARSDALLFGFLSSDSPRD